jgi:hypothetical protein
MKPNAAQTLFYYYFCAANVDYVNLDDALRLLLLRVACPEDRQSLFAIFCALADAFRTKDNRSDIVWIRRSDHLFGNSPLDRLRALSIEIRPEIARITRLRGDAGLDPPHRRGAPSHVVGPSAGRRAGEITL